MTPENAKQKRAQLITDGFCIVDNVLTDELLNDLRRETDRMLDSIDHPPHWKFQGSDLNVNSCDEPVINRLIHWKHTRDALDALGLGDFKADETMIILSKPPGGPALYWHQDWRRWNDPISTAPWPQYLFLSYYLTDTNFENGCLRVIPGTHTKRIDLHDLLTTPHTDAARNVDEHDQYMFCDHPHAVDVPVRAGSLVIAEGRMLHAAHANHSDQRRTLLLCWHRRSTEVPENWTGEIPESILNRDPETDYEPTRVPGSYLV